MYNIFCCSGFTWLDGLVGQICGQNDEGRLLFDNGFTKKKVEVQTNFNYFIKEFPSIRRSLSSIRHLLCINVA